MSKENAKKFITDSRMNDDLRRKVQGLNDIDELIKRATEAGYAMTKDELAEAEREYRAEVSAERELSMEELSSVAGGFLFNSDYSRDGREFGCAIFNLHRADQERMNEWCRERHYCAKVNFGGTNESCSADYMRNGSEPGEGGDRGV